MTKASVRITKEMVSGIVAYDPELGFLTNGKWMLRVGPVDAAYTIKGQTKIEALVDAGVRFSSHYGLKDVYTGETASIPDMGAILEGRGTASKLLTKTIWLAGVPAGSLGFQKQTLIRRYKLGAEGSPIYFDESFVPILDAGATISCADPCCPAYVENDAGEVIAVVMPMDNDKMDVDGEF